MEKDKNGRSETMLNQHFNSLWWKRGASINVCWGKNNKSNLVSVSFRWVELWSSQPQTQEVRLLQPFSIQGKNDGWEIINQRDRFLSFEMRGQFYFFTPVAIVWAFILFTSPGALLCAGQAQGSEVHYDTKTVNLPPLSTKLWAVTSSQQWLFHWCEGCGFRSHANDLGFLVQSGQSSGHRVT